MELAALSAVVVIGLLSFGGAVLSINANLRQTGQRELIDDLLEGRKDDRAELARLGREVGHLRREVQECESDKVKLRRELEAALGGPT